MDLFNLTAKLTIDTEDYEKGIDKSKTKNKELEDNTKKTSKGSVIAWTAVATAVLAVVKGITNLITSTADYADQIGDIADKWGFTTQQIQEFDYWATLNGTTLESLLTGMRGLVNQAEAGSSAFNKLGVSVKNTDGTFKDQRTLFMETLDALQKVENQVERNALQFEIFGRSGIELGQIVNLTSEQLNALSQEAENLGIILSKDAIQQASDFNDNLDRIRLSFKGVLASLMSGDAEAEQKLDEFLEFLTERIEEWTPKFVEITAKLLVAVVESLIKMLPTILDSFMDATANMLLEFDWVEIGKSIFNFMIKGMLYSLINNPITALLSKIFGFDLKEVNQGIANIDVFGQKTKSAVNSINSVNSSSNINSDNSSYNVSVNVNGTGYAEEDAKRLAEEVIKEIATKKQASGR